MEWNTDGPVNFSAKLDFQDDSGSLVAFSRDTISFYKHSYISNNYKLVKNHKLLIFLQDAYNAFSALGNNATDLAEQFNAHINGFQEYETFIKKYDLKCFNVVKDNKDFDYSDLVEHNDNKHFDYTSPYPELFLKIYSDSELSNKDKAHAIYRIISKERPAYTNSSTWRNYLYLVPIETIDEVVPMYPCISLDFVVLIAVIHALEQNITPFNICKTCGKAFVPKRSDAVFCSNKCKKIWQKESQPLKKAVESREITIRRQIGTDPALSNSYEMWQQEVIPIRKKYEEKIKDHSENTSDLVQEFKHEIKCLWDLRRKNIDKKGN